MTKHKRTDSNNTGQIVLTAIKKLTRNTGWTARTIVKFIKIEYKLNDDKLSQNVRRALKRGVRLGLLQTASGRYRLNDMSRLARVHSSVVRHNLAGLRRQRRRPRPLMIDSRSPSAVPIHRQLTTNSRSPSTTTIQQPLPDNYRTPPATSIHH